MRLAALSLDDGWVGLAPGARVRAPWHDGAVYSLAHSPDGSLVCSAGADGVVRVWDVARGELRWQFERPARHLLASPDGRLVYALDEAFALWPLDLVTGDELERAWAPTRRVPRGARPDRAALSPDGRWLLPSSGDDRGGVEVVDLAGRASYVLEAPGAGELHPVGAFSADGRAVYSLGAVREGRTGRGRNALYRFALSDGACDEIRALRFPSQSGPVAVALHRHRCVFGGRWMVVSEGRVLLRWELARSEAASWLDAPLAAMGRVVTGDRAFACTFANHRGVATGSHAEGALRAGLTLPDGETASTLSLAPDERTLYVGTMRGRVTRVALSDGDDGPR